MPTIELDRFRIAIDGDDVVGTAGSFGLEMTVPGGGTLPTGGVTWVSCAVTHRRQGVLRALIKAIHDDIDARDEPLAALGASEGGIYERFGYGVASMRRGIEIDRRRAQLRPEYQPSPGSVRLVHPDEAVALFLPRWDRARRLRPGRSTATRRGCGCWSPRSPTPRCAPCTTTASRCGRPIRNGTWGTRPTRCGCTTWRRRRPRLTPRSWHTLLSLDLTGPIRSLVVPIDDPLPYLLTDRRALRTTVVNDGLWLNLRDVKRCFEARTYGTDDDIVIEADGVRWRIGGGGCAGCAAGPICRRITPRSRRCSSVACGRRRWSPGGG